MPSTSAQGPFVAMVALLLAGIALFSVVSTKPAHSPLGRAVATPASRVAVRAEAAPKFRVPSRRELCVGGSLAAIQALTMPVYAMDRAAAEQARIARRAKMKEKYGSGELTKDEARLLKEVEEEVYSF